jgi:hypothetical protein
MAIGDWDIEKALYDALTGIGAAGGTLASVVAA